MICISTGIRGAVINSENLLYLADKIKSGAVTYEDSFTYFNSNDEVKELV